MAENAPSASLEIGDDPAWPFYETGETRGRAAEQPPKKSEDEQGKNEDSADHVEIQPILFGRPPLERDQDDQEPMEDPRRQVPDPNAPGDVGRHDQSSGARNRSWQFLQVSPSAFRR